MSFAKEQPKDGDRLLHCGHMEADRYHFWKAPGPILTMAPTGDMVEVAWLVACHSCMLAADGNPKKIAFHGCYTWRGNDPVIRTSD